MEYGNCADGCRDDDFIVFSSHYTQCTLNQTAHYALMAVWCGLTVLGLAENAVAQYRGTDKSPVFLRAGYIVWLLLSVLQYAYVLARPLASVFNVTDAAVMLTVLALRGAIGTTLSVGIQRHLIMTGTQAVSMHASDPQSKRAGPKTVFALLHLVTMRVFVPQVAVAAICLVVLVALLPNALGVDTAAPWLLETFLMIGWIVTAFLSLSQPMALSYVTWRVRQVVKESVSFNTQRQRPSPTPSNNGSPNLGVSPPPTAANPVAGPIEAQSSSSSSQFLSLPPFRRLSTVSLSAQDASGPSTSRPASPTGSRDGSQNSSNNRRQARLDTKMARLERRLRSNVVRGFVMNAISSLVYIVAAVIGMQYWVFHIVASQGILFMWLYLVYYRPSVFSSFKLDPEPADDVHRNREGSTNSRNSGGSVRSNISSHFRPRSRSVPMLDGSRPQSMHIPPSHNSRPFSWFAPERPVSWHSDLNETTVSSGMVTSASSGRGVSGSRSLSTFELGEIAASMPPAASTIAGSDGDDDTVTVSYIVPATPI